VANEGNLNESEKRVTGSRESKRSAAEGPPSASRLAAVLGGTITRVGALSAIVGNYGVRL
jgi:hypothetical protein